MRTSIKRMRSSGPHRSRAATRRLASTVTESELIDSIRRAISAKTRIVAVTWVHSSTGVKIPVKSIGAAISEINRHRDDPVKRNEI